jgi:hypothetical protein
MNHPTYLPLPLLSHLYFCFLLLRRHSNVYPGSKNGFVRSRTLDLPLPSVFKMSQTTPKKNWASVVSGKPPNPHAETWQAKEEAKRKAEAEAKRKAEEKKRAEAKAKRELQELMRWAQEQDGGGCLEHDLIGCRECAFNASGRCHSELHEYYGGTEW